MKPYEQMSDYEKAVFNRDGKVGETNEGESPVDASGAEESAPVAPGGTPSNAQLAAGLVSLENALRQLAEAVNKNAKMSDDNFAGMGRHVADLEAQIKNAQQQPAAT